ncbi:MAG TPA: hypothetical protein VL443_27440 [Cyclobacteriaceae bacterium]|jgi:hypothetical protein|nr:hypothetical protein [Cyclobacteriaceae bacterium]
MSGIGSAEILISFILFTGLSILVFLALRVFVLWYWKVNDIVTNQEKQIKLLRDILMFLRDESERKRELNDN